MKPGLRFTILAMIALPAVLSAQAVPTPTTGEQGRSRAAVPRAHCQTHQTAAGPDRRAARQARKDECAICSAASPARRAGARHPAAAPTGDDGRQLGQPAARKRSAQWGDTHPEAANRDSRGGAEGARRISYSGTACPLHRATNAIQKTRRRTFGEGWPAEWSARSSRRLADVRNNRSRKVSQRQSGVEAVDFPPPHQSAGVSRSRSIG